jgi:hypothetical protein
MAEEFPRAASDAVRARLQSELDSQLREFGARQSGLFDEMRRAIETEAEERWARHLDGVRDEWSTRLQSELATAAAETERRVLDESARGRAEAERAAGEREQATRDLEAERQKVTALNQQIASLSDARENEELAARATERQEQLAVIESLLFGIKAIDAAPTLSGALGALVDGAVAVAPRAALFVVSGRQLQMWKAVGFPEVGPLQTSELESSVLGAAMRARDAVSTTAAAPPAFASLSSNRAGLAVPITIGGQAVAVLYADDGAVQESETPASWPEAVQILGLHASVSLAHMTAVWSVEGVRQPAASRAGRQ